jgi:hypothetical protein
MTDEETTLLKRRWKYQNKWRTFGNVMGKMEGFETMDLSREGLIVLYNGEHEFGCTIADRTLEISLRAAPGKTLRLRISELTTDKLALVVCAPTGDTEEDKMTVDLVELYFAPAVDNEAIDIQKA